ncbi:MAG TPA: ABC transporter permease [Nitrospiria bacterium]|jgi:ABC-2 type transport system permease protein
MYFFLDTWFLFQKYMKITLRMPLWSLFTLVQPLIWLLIFGQLFRNFSSMPGFPSQSYMEFFLPGVLIMTVLFGSSWSGVSLLRELNFGVVSKMLVSPIYRSSIVLSRVLHSAVTVLIQTLIIFGVAWVMGAATPVSGISFLLTLVLIFLLAVGFASLSNGFAMVLQREEPLVVIGNLMTLPLLFFSSALVPAEFLPSWIGVIASVNPIHYAVEGVRKVLVGDFTLQSLWLEHAVLLVFAVLTLVWATFIFMRRKD